MMRDLATALPDGTLWFGDVRVGLPAADIPEGSLLEDAAADYPNDLLRVYSPSIPDGTVMNEDGSRTGAAPSLRIIYRNGVPIEYIGYGSGGERKRRCFGSGLFNG